MTEVHKVGHAVGDGDGASTDKLGRDGDCVSSAEGTRLIGEAVEIACVGDEDSGEDVITMGEPVGTRSLH